MNYAELVPVLDQGFVRLVNGTDYADLAIVRSARVSYDADWRSGVDEGNDEKLIRYLWKNGHTSPFEVVNLTFEVKAPIFVLRQWHRHRTQSYNEVSGRYAEILPEFYYPSPENIGKQSTKNKQVRDLSTEPLSSRELNFLQHQIRSVKEANEEVYALYKHLLDHGWPRELARMILPLNIYTRMFVTVDLHNLFKFLRLRDHGHAQWEIQQYAKAMKNLAGFVAPVATAAFVEIG